MTIAPARVAGAPWISAATPPSRNGAIDPGILVALDIAGVREIYRIGGAHAVAALAYGTESIARVEKSLALEEHGLLLQNLLFRRIHV